VRSPPCSSLHQITAERFWLPAWPLLERLHGTDRVLCRDVAVIKAFALDIIQRRRKQLAAEEAAAAGGGGGGGGDRARDQGPVVSSSSSADVVSGGSDVAAGGEVARDLLSLFMTARGPDGQPLSTQQLIDTVINFIIAGRDTTAQVGIWGGGAVESDLHAGVHHVMPGQPSTAQRSAAQHMVRVVLAPFGDYVHRLCAGPGHTCED